MKKILPLLLLMLCCITMYAQERYTFEKITVTLTKDNLHPAQVLRTRKLNKYNKPVYEENYRICVPNKMIGDCTKDSSEIERAVVYEYTWDTILVKKTSFYIFIAGSSYMEDTTVVTYKYDKQGRLTEEFSIHYGLEVWGCTSDGVPSWNDATNIYHKYDSKGRLTEDLIVRADRPGRGFTGYDPEDKAKYFYDNSGRLSRMEHYNVWSMGTYRHPPADNIDTTLQFQYTYQYEQDRNIETVIKKRDGRTDTVNVINNYNDPYRNVLPTYITTPERFYTIYLYDHKNKLLSERTYGGADNVLMTEKKY
ncbi:MAG TPA: hypothetical protein VGD89_15740 [Flavipsychrobacter sp.]